MKIKTFLKISIKKLKNFYESIFDFIYLTYIFFDFKNKAESKQKDLVIVTAADSNYYEKANRLINSISNTNPNIKIYIYNLDQNQTFKINCKINNSIEIINFNFDNVPNFVSQYTYQEYDNDKKLGNYAWKAVIIDEVAKNSNGLLLWVDSGSIVSKKLNLIKQLINKKNFYCAKSSNKVADWTHKSVLSELNISQKIYNKENVSAGLIGINLSSQNSLDMIDIWKNWCLKKELIAPEGSNRSNHRQDQTLLTLIIHLFFKKIIVPKHLYFLGVKIQVK